MGLRRARTPSVAPERSDDQPFGVVGRPLEVKKRRIPWIPVFLRILTIAWAGAIIAALLDTFGNVPHLPFLTAIGMTGMLVLAMFLFTQALQSDPADRTAGVDEGEDTVHDLLTDLPTYAHFQRRLNDEFARSRRMGRKISVVLVDVNNLSAVNKEYGVKAGDEVLRHVARAVEGTRRYNDIIARLGDDEFGVILLDTGPDGVGAFVDRLEDRLARESAVADVGGRSVALWAGVCSGSCVSVPSVTSAEEILEGAMQNLNQAKQDRERRRRTWLTA